MAVDEPVPLPAILGTCDCAFRPHRHKTTCQVAIDFDSIPLHDRPEYELGRRFAAISWDYPVTFHGNLRIDIGLDPVSIIRDRADEYRAFEMEPGYEAWEKPMVFLTKLIEDQYDIGGVFFGGRRLAADHSFMDNLSDDRWTPEDTERLHAALDDRPLDDRPDPNQGVLGISDDHG